jgi:hypothetical protein
MDNQYYSISIKKSLLEGFKVPVHQQEEPLSTAGFAQLIDMDLIAMRQVPQPRIDRDWDRVGNLFVTTPDHQTYTYSPSTETKETVIATSQTREDFLGVIKSNGGPELAAYFQKYFQQQGFSDLPRTLVTSLVQEHLNKNGEGPLKTLIEKGQSHASSTYISITAPGIIEYDMYNAYSQQRTDYHDADMTIEDGELPFYTHLKGRISYDSQTGDMTHTLCDMDFIVNEYYSKDLKDFFKPAEPKDLLGKVVAFFNPQSLPSFLEEKSIPETSHLTDFVDRFMAYEISASRKNSQTPSTDSDESSDSEYELISKTLLLSPTKVNSRSSSPKNKPGNQP